MTSPTRADARSACGCGSGLGADRCCALDWGQDWPEGNGLPPIDRTRAALQAGEVATAERAVLERLERNPTNLPALGLLYELRAAQGRSTAAEALLRRIVRLEPDNPASTIALALMLVRKGALEQAEPFARSAVRLSPNDPLAHNLMGAILTEARQPQAGEYHYRRVLELVEAPNAALLAALAWNLKTQGRIEEARQFFRQAVDRDPNRFDTFYGWARTEEADRRFTRAGELLDAAERLASGHPHVLLQRAVLHRRLNRDDQALAALDDVQRRIDAGGAAAAADKGLMLDLCNERGVLLDKVGRHAEAFAAFAQAKRLMSELTGQTYLAADAAEQEQRLKAFFVAPRIQRLPRAGVRADTRQPIFIVGFPRSGTTMVEQTLSAHPLISAGDELPIINELTERAPQILGSALPYPEALADLGRSDQSERIDALRDYYLQRARDLGAIGDDAAWFTDKMPLNETQLGLISLMFPRAPIIHLLRHPLDVALSVFANHMTHGFYCASELASIANHYVLSMGLVEHYRREMPLRYLPIRYEDVIDRQEARVREMLDFIGARYDERCLSFHENHRYARTASYAQVSEKLYDRSRYRYRAYRDQLEPVIPILEPWIRRLGYEID